jgi:hypothetical protein
VFDDDTFYVIRRVIGIQMRICILRARAKSQICDPPHNCCWPQIWLHKTKRLPHLTKLMVRPPLDIFCWSDVRAPLFLSTVDDVWIEGVDEKYGDG